METGEGLRPNFRHMATGQPPCHVLLVDDQRFFLALGRDILASEGYRVNTACNGSDALEMARITRPDVILLDVEMPGMDGFETCRRLKADPRTADIPAVFLTSTLDPCLKQRALEAGGAAAFVKALSPDRLQGILRAICVTLRPRARSGVGGGTGPAHGLRGGSTGSNRTVRVSP